MRAKRRVLILDFDEELLMTAERTVQDYGFRATTTWNESEGRILMQTNCFDFLLIANRPPALNAQEFISGLRQRGLSFGSFVLGSLNQPLRDGCRSLIDQLSHCPEIGGCSLSA